MSRAWANRREPWCDRAAAGVTETAKAVEHNANATSERRNVDELSIRNWSFFIFNTPVSPPAFEVAGIRGA
jgi:hypothetical protein